MRWGSPVVRSLYEHFLEEHAGTSLNSLYCTLGQVVRPDPPGFAEVTAKELFACIPKELEGSPIALVVDDTTVPKAGKKLANVKALSDHSRHDGGQHLNAHDMVTVVMSVLATIGSDGRVECLSAPQEHRMRVPDGESKLEMAKKMLLEVRDVLEGKWSFSWPTAGARSSRSSGFKTSNRSSL